MGEHAISFEYFAMLATLCDVAVLQHRIEIGAQRRDCSLKASAFFDTLSAMKLVMMTRGSCSTT